MSAKKSLDSRSGRAGGKKAPVAQPDKASSVEYGREGTNKTIPEPKADTAPSEELGHTPHVVKSPYTRG